MRLLTCIAAAGLLAAAPALHAGSVRAVYYQSASGFCQPALPAFDGLVRKRPTAVANEGTANAFVSCSMPSWPTGEGVDVNLGEVELVLANRGTQAAQLSCTLVNAFEPGGAAVVRTATAAAGQRAFLTWTIGDFGGAPLEFLNFSCLLPPRTEVAYGFYYYDPVP
jgi:hypothetical protein